MKNSIKSLMLLTALGIISQNALAKKTSGELFNSLAKVAKTQNTSSALTKRIKNAPQNNSELFYGIADSYKDAINRGALGKAATSYIESYVQNITSDVQGSIKDIVKAYECLLETPFNNARKTIETKLSQHVGSLASNIGDNFVNNENLKKLAQIEDAIVLNTNAKNAFENNTNTFDTMKSIKTKINAQYPNLKDSKDKCFTDQSPLSEMATEIDKSANEQKTKNEQVVIEQPKPTETVVVQQETVVAEQTVNNDIEKSVEQITINQQDEIVEELQQEENNSEQQISPYTPDQHFLIGKMQQDFRKQQEEQANDKQLVDYKPQQKKDKDKKSLRNSIKSIFSFLSMNNDAAKEMASDMALEMCDLDEDETSNDDTSSIEKIEEQTNEIEEDDYYIIPHLITNGAKALGSFTKKAATALAETSNEFTRQIGQGDLYEEDNNEKQLENKQQQKEVKQQQITSEKIEAPAPTVEVIEVPAKKASSIKKYIKTLFSFSSKNDTAKDITLEMCDLNDEDETSNGDTSSIEKKQQEREAADFLKQEKNKKSRIRKIKAIAKNLGLTTAIVAIVAAYITHGQTSDVEVINPILEIAKEATTCGLNEAPKTLASRAAECYTSCSVNKKCIEKCLEQLYKFVMWKNEHGV